MDLPPPRGPVSGYVIDALGRDGDQLGDLVLGPGPVLDDADVQLALWVLYELHFRGFDTSAPEREWDPGLLALRRDLERRFERELREATQERLAERTPSDDVAGDLLTLVASDDSPSPASYLQRHGSRDQMLDFLRERSVAQLKESDPQAFVVARLEGPAKVALAEVQYDEFGAGRPEHLHQTLYADALEAAGLDPTYGAYLPEISGISLAMSNVMSMFALHRRLRGAAVGHFAAFEASSSVPSRKIAMGLDRLGFPPAVSAYFQEHVEADAVHEQVAARDICGNLVQQHPELRDDVLFGAATALHLDALSAEELLGRWHSAEATPSLDLEEAS